MSRKAKLSVLTHGNAKKKKKKNHWSGNGVHLARLSVLNGGDVASS